MTEIDNASVHDNRNYDYTEETTEPRAEYPAIVELVDENSSIIDLGCGNGSLLEILNARKNCSGLGMDVSASAINVCEKKGIVAKRKPIDQPHPEFKNKEFDFAICNATIQMVMYPEVLIHEMGRISKKQIISFPNFAYYRNRLDLLLHGRMPKPLLFNYDWYSTGHIHQFSVADFEQYCAKNKIRVLERRFVSPPSAGLKASIKQALEKKYPNLFAIICIYLLESAQ